MNLFSPSRLLHKQKFLSFFAIKKHFTKIYICTIFWIFTSWSFFHKTKLQVEGKKLLKFLVMKFCQFKVTFNEQPKAFRAVQIYTKSETMKFLLHILDSLRWGMKLHVKHFRWWEFATNSYKRFSFFTYN